MQNIFKKICAILIVFPSLAPALARAQELQTQQVPLRYAVPSITVTGVASTEVVPNIAILSLGVATEKPKAQDAANENAGIAQNLVAAMKAQGVDARDIRTQSVTLTPVYDEVKDANGHLSQKTLRGYSAKTEFIVRVRNTDNAGKLAQQFMDGGANIFKGITFDYDQKEQKFDGLRADAARDALRKANIYVTALGLRLGRAIVIAPPNTQSMPGPMRATAFSDMDRAATPVPVEPGVETLRSEVEVVWELVK